VDASVEYCDEKSVSRRVQFEARVPRNHQALECVMAITRFQTGVSWHFRSLKDEVLKIEFYVFSANLRLRV